MTHLTFTNNGKTYRQITKRTAKKLFCEGKTVIASPANIRPFNSYGFTHFEFNKAILDDYDRENYGIEKSFDNIVNTCVYYNCDNETGRYLRFYAEF